MLDIPKAVLIQNESGLWISLQKHDASWSDDNIEIETRLINDNELPIRVHSAAVGIQRIKLQWERENDFNAEFTGDAFERAYGDLQLTGLDEEKIYYWYFLEQKDQYGIAYGVKVQPNSFCAWTINQTTITLWIDLRNGTRPLQIERLFECCTVVKEEYKSNDTFSSLCDFCQIMATDQVVRIDAEPVVGINDWYYAYGHNNRELILKNTAEIVKLCQPLSYRPWVVIDDGWQVAHSDNYNGGPWSQANGKFDSMASIATKIRQLGARPGIWYRPLFTNDNKYREFWLRDEGDGFILDISNPKVQQMVHDDIVRFKKWGFELVKFDFSCVDILGQMGNTAKLDYYRQSVQFSDHSASTAEIFKELYHLIRNAAEDMTIIGCNVVSHLAVGMIDLMRIGDDTSGHQFHRTVAMGVNSLAFRLPQEQIFYKIDADCVGITDQITWKQNLEWLRLIAESGTALFISCDFEKLTGGQLQDIQKYISIDLHGQKHFRPKILNNGRYPTNWQDEKNHYHYNWDYSLFEHV